jgi:energy-coupling factor transport system ATP-binding protein
LLLDEPTALLDRDRQAELVATVKQLVKENHLTALWVTHRLDELDFADGAFLLQDGKVVDRGDPIRLKQMLHPKSWLAPAYL